MSETPSTAMRREQPSGRRSGRGRRLAGQGLIHTKL